MCFSISDTSASDALAPYKKWTPHAESESDDDDHKDIKTLLADTVGGHKSLKPKGALDEGGDSGVLGKCGNWSS